MRHHHHFHSRLQEIKTMKRRQLDFKVSKTNDYRKQTKWTTFDPLS